MNFKNILLLPFIFLVGCELDYKDKDKVSTSTPTVASFELLDPNAAASNEFGSTTVTLANGNIVVASPFDDTVASNAGAVHLYNAFMVMMRMIILGCFIKVCRGLNLASPHLRTTTL
jgi:hypothetical protein